VYAFGATVGCAIYFVVAARDPRGLPPIALASFGLLLGGLTLLGLAGMHLLTVTVSYAPVAMFGADLPWWMLIALIAVIPTAFAYVAGISGAQLVGSQIASFVGLLEVVFASVLAWVLLGQSLTPIQLVGGAVLIGGIIAVRSRGRTRNLRAAAEKPLISGRTA
jgi:drug/metabolite transporter (DMT)-like permease